MVWSSSSSSPQSQSQSPTLRALVLPEQTVVGAAFGSKGHSPHLPDIVLSGGLALRRD